MATVATAPKNERKLVPEGTHVARLYKFMNLGTRFQMFEGRKKDFPDTLITLTFEVPNEIDKFTVTKEDGTTEEVEKPLVITREFTLSMGPKSNLRPFVNGILGTNLGDDEAYSFDLENLVDKYCLISVIHKPSLDGSKTYAKVVSASPLMKGQIPPPPFNKNQVFNVNTASKEDIDALPEFLKEKITVSDEYRKRFGTEDSPNLEEEDVPF